MSSTRMYLLKPTQKLLRYCVLHYPKVFHHNDEQNGTKPVHVTMWKVTTTKNSTILWNRMSMSSNNRIFRSSSSWMFSPMTHNFLSTVQLYCFTGIKCRDKARFAHIPTQYACPMTSNKLIPLVKRNKPGELWVLPPTLSQVDVCFFCWCCFWPKY